MKRIHRLSRRRFIGSGLLASTVMSMPTLPRVFSAATSETPDRGLKLGVTSYTFRKFSLEQAIAMTREAALKYISLKDMHQPLKSTPAERKQAHVKVEQAGLVLMGGGVIYMKNDEREIRDAFEYAKDAGMPTIICSPDPEALDTVEKLAKQYRVRIAIHNHGPGDKRYPSPLDVLALVKERDPLMGLCMDVGHTVRLGLDPVKAIEQCAARLYDFHMKDVTAANAKGGAVQVGKGVIDIPGVLKALLEAKFAYHVALEYETDANNPLPGVKNSIQYIRGVLELM